MCQGGLFTHSFQALEEPLKQMGQQSLKWDMPAALLHTPENNGVFFSPVYAVARERQYSGYIKKESKWIILKLLLPRKS